MARWVRRRQLLATAGSSIALVVAAYFLGPSWIEVDGRRELVWPARPRQVEWAPDGYERQSRTLGGLPWRTARWDPPKVPTHGELLVACPTAGAVVSARVDGRSRRWAAGTRARLPRGVHRLRIEAPGHRTRVEVAGVDGGERRAIQVALEPLAGRLTLTAEPAGARLHVGPERTLGLPVRGLDWPAGELVGTVVAPGHRSRELRLRVPAGQAVARHLTLAPLRRWVRRFDGEVAWLRSVGTVPGVPRRGLLVVGPTRMVLYDARRGAVIWDLETPIDTPPLIGDHDRDGVDDVWVQAGTWVQVISGDDGRQLARFALPSVLSRPAALCDLDGDGAHELLGIFPTVGHRRDGRRGYQVMVFDPRRPGRPLLTVETTTMGPYSPVPLAGDLDGDGQDEIVVADMGGRVQGRRFDGELRALRVSGGEARQRWRRVVAGGMALVPQLTDLEGKGRFELVLARQDGLVARIDGEGEARWERPLEPRPRTVVCCQRLRDLDGDGVADVVAAATRHDAGRVYVISGATGELTVRSMGRRLAEAPAPEVLDHDGDGRAELLVRMQQSLLLLPRSEGPAIARLPLDPPTNAPMWTEDFDGDGAVEVAVAGYGGRVSLFAAPADGWRHRLMGVAAGIAVGRLAGGKGPRDLVVAVGGAPPRLQAHAGDDGRRLWSATLTARPISPPALGDLQGDGGLDAVVATTGQVVAVDGATGATLWRQRSAVSLATPPALGDVDGDGAVDVVVPGRPRNQGFQAVLPIDGKTGQVGAAWVPGDLLVGGPAAVDVDADGRCDLLMAGAQIGEGVGRLHVLHLGTRRARAMRVPLVPGAPPAWLGESRRSRQLVLVHGRQGAGWTMAAVDISAGTLAWTNGAMRPAVIPPLLLDVDGDGVRDVILATARSVVARSGVSGSRLWTVAPGQQAVSLGAGRDLDGDGRAELILGLSAERALVLAGRDGAPLAEIAGGRWAALDGARAFGVDQRVGMIGSRPVRVRRPRPSRMVALGAYDAAIRALGRRRSREAQAWRGVARFELALLDERSDVRPAVSGLRAAVARWPGSLEQVERLAVALVRSGQMTREHLGGLPEAAVVGMLRPGRLTPQQMSQVVLLARGQEETPAMLLLQQQYGAALRALKGRRDVMATAMRVAAHGNLMQLSLRAGQLAGAHTHAIETLRASTEVQRLHPWSRQARMARATMRPLVTWALRTLGVR